MTNKSLDLNHQPRRKEQEEDACGVIKAAQTESYSSTRYLASNGWCFDIVE